jgi:hypothetical protein
MAEIKVFQCDFCQKSDTLPYLTERDTVHITIPGVKIGGHTYRKNDGHACSKCAEALSDILENVVELEADAKNVDTDRAMAEAMDYRPGRN